MSHHYHFKSSIPPEQVDRRAEERGCESRSEYLRLLIREDQRAGVAEASAGGN